MCTDGPPHRTLGPPTQALQPQRHPARAPNPPPPELLAQPDPAVTLPAAARLPDTCLPEFSPLFVLEATGSRVPRGTNSFCRARQAKPKDPGRPAAASCTHTRSQGCPEPSLVGETARLSSRPCFPGPQAAAGGRAIRAGVTGWASPRGLSHPSSLYAFFQPECGRGFRSVSSYPWPRGTSEDRQHQPRVQEPLTPRDGHTRCGLSVSHELHLSHWLWVLTEHFCTGSVQSPESPEPKSLKATVFSSVKGGRRPARADPSHSTHRMPLPPNQRKDQSQSRASRAEGPRTRLLRGGVQRSWGWEQGTHSPARRQKPAEQSRPITAVSSPGHSPCDRS